MSLLHYHNPTDSAYYSFKSVASMDSLHHIETTKNSAKLSNEPICTNPSCFFCSMKEPNPLLRKSKLIKCFKEMPTRHDHELVLPLSGLWNIAMTQPNNPEFPSLGIFDSMTKLINRGIKEEEWLFKNQNIYIPYYAAHIIGSYTMNIPQFAEIAVNSGVVLSLMELLRGKISWVEQRVAARALGHLASHDITFDAVAEHEGEIIPFAMKIASTCLDHVYSKFVSLKHSKRLKYHCDLLTRGLGGLETENRKAEEWASQLQCWSLYILNCFVLKQRSISLICKKKFINRLCDMWGGLTNQSSPGGIGLIRTLCNTQKGRESISQAHLVIQVLGNLARSSDDWRFMAIDCLLLLLKDPQTRFKVLDISVIFLADLVELEFNGIGGSPNPKPGDAITQTLLQDFHKIKYGDLKLKSERAERAIEEVWDSQVERKKREKLMSDEEVRERKLMVSRLKQEGKMMFLAGEIEKAAIKYSEALDSCLSEMRKQRIVLHSNRAQCFLLLWKPDAAIRNTTRALCLSSAERPHGKSLWRRSQAYDMKGLTKESLMDCVLFVSVSRRIKSEHTKPVKIPYYAARMINKQMSSTWIFSSAKSKANGRG